MTNRTVSVPSLGYKSESRRKRDGNTRTSTPEIDIWKKFISNEDHFLDEDGGPTLNFQAPFHFLPSKEPTKTSREQTDSPKRQNLQSTNSTLTKRSKLAIPSKSKSEPSSMVQVVPVPSIQQRMEEVAAKKIDLNSYNHWKGNLFQKLKEHPAVTEKTKNYFIKREDDLSKEEAEDINTNSTEDQIKLNNLLSNLERGIPVNPFLHSAEGNRRRQVRTNVDTSRLPFDALQQEQHRQLQEEAWRISQEHLTNLPPTPNQKGQRKTSVGNTKKSNRNSSKLIHAKRSPSLPDEEGLISSAPVSTPRSKMKKNGSSSSLFTISPPDRKLQKSPARKKPFSTFIKKLESVPSPRRTKLKERSGREIHLPDDSPSRESESFIRQLEAREDEDDLVEDLSTFILSPKRKSAILRPGKPRHWEVNNRSHSMTLTNSPVQGKEISDFVQDSVEDEDSLSLTDTPLDFIESTDIKSDEDDNKDVECNVHLNTPCVL